MTQPATSTDTGSTVLPDPFCPICQQVRAECRCTPTHTLARERERVEGHGDTPLSPKPARPQRPGQHKRRSGDTGTPTPVSPPRTSWTAPELMAADFPPLRWAIPGLVAEGISLIAGPPKAGKSWLVLGTCVAVASGGKALGAIDVEIGQALYLALEDTGRRLQDRMRVMLTKSEPPANLTLTTQCPPMNQGGLDLIDKWITHQPNPRLVVIDVFEKIRGPSHPGESAYSADYNAVTRIKELADIHRVPIVLLHHVRKGMSDDFINEISGTLGLAGAADSIAVLRRKRGEVDGQLLITGRDVDEQEYAVRFAPELGTWQLLGLASEFGLADTRAKIRGALAELTKGTPKEIAMATGLDYELVKKTCQRMLDDGQLVKDRSRYRTPPVGVPLSPDTSLPSSDP